MLGHTTSVFEEVEVHLQEKERHQAVAIRVRSSMEKFL